jgi:serine/threonine-protein kinase
VETSTKRESTILGLPEPPKPESPTRREDGRDALHEGAILLGRYRLERELGMGGMATVYAASHVTIGAPVAIKVLHASLATRRPAVERFLGEARAIASVQHPNVVRVSDYGELPDGRPFMVMEYLRGCDLARRLEQSSPIPWSTMRPILLQVCAGLQAAHEVGIVHCDVKPQNIFLLDDGGPLVRVKVLDFGIAKVSDPMLGDGGRARSMEGVLVGTPDYMAPEQSSGAEIDARADIYALGVTLFRTLTGQLPFVSNHWFHTVTQHMYRTPPRPRSIEAAIPEAVEAVVLRALQKRPDDRFASMRSFAEAASSIRDTDASTSATAAMFASDSAEGSSVVALASSRARGLAVGATVAAAIVAALWWGSAPFEAESIEPAPARVESTEAVRAASVRPVQPSPPAREPLIVEAPPVEADPDPAPPRTMIPQPPPSSTSRKLGATPRRAARPAPPIEPPTVHTVAETPEPVPVVQPPPRRRPLRIEEVKDPFD